MDKQNFTISLTKDELVTLQYILDITSDSYGDPLKNAYELGEDKPENIYSVARDLAHKMGKLKWE